jgi:hypothetical protein
MLGAVMLNVIMPTLQIHNMQKKDGLYSKLVSSFLSVNFTSLDEHTSLLCHPCIKNL